MRGQTELIGLLGGMSWQSTALYYRLLNEAVFRELGGHHNARSVLFTLNYDDLDAQASAGRWDKVGEAIGDAARRIEQAGADFVMITAVTGHAVAEQVQA
ncbi:aspartate/glutamate racemase family protein, partial [Rhizobiaceae sp. 2RAB30]